MPTYLSPNSDIVIDDAGNIGFNTADIEAWSTLFRAFQLSAQCAIAWNVAGEKLYLVVNAYATDEFEWRYRADGDAMRLMLTEDIFTLSRANDGLADAVIDWITEFVSSASLGVQIGEVGAGTSRLSVKITDADEAVGVGGVHYARADLSVGNVGTGEDPLFSTTLGADMLGRASEALIFEFWGTTANNANVKTLRFRFGASGTNLAFSRTMTPSIANSWRLKVTVHHVTDSTQRSVASVQDGTASDLQIVTTLNQDATAAVVISLTGEATSNNDIVVLGAKIWWEPIGAI